MAVSDILTVAEAAKKLHIGLNLMYSYTRRPGFPCFKVGKKIRIREADLEEWIISHYK